MLSDPRTRLTTVGQAIMSVYKRFRWVTIMLAAGSAGESLWSRGDGPARADSRSRVRRGEWPGTDHRAMTLSISGPAVFGVCKPGSGSRAMAACG